MRVNTFPVLGAGSRASFLLLAWLVSTCSAASVVCDGTDLSIQDGLYGITGATLQSRAEDGGGGPNLVTNGDFSFDADGVDRNGAAVSLGLINGPPVLIQAWTAAGGGALTYARWGGAVSQNTAYDWAGVAGVAGANRSMVYFGNAGEWGYKNVTSFVGFDLNGFAQQDGLVFYTKYSSANFGDNGKPVSISQQVSNLNIGTRYRLQFFQACEDGFLRPAGNRYNQTGVAALELTGYDRTYVSVPSLGQYRTLDFIAKSANTTITFKSWGHILINGPPDVLNCDPAVVAGCATEIALDDVILTECADPEPPCPSNNLVIETSGPTMGSTASSTHPEKHVNNKRAPSSTIKAPKKSNRKLSYRVRVSSTEKGAVAGNVGVIVTLPAGVTYKRAAIRPKSVGTPTVDGDSTTGTTLTWENLSVAYKKSLAMKVTATISTTTPLNTPLTFTAAIVTPDSDGEPTCLEYAGDTTITVIP